VRAAVSYESLLTVFWDRHDPTTLNRQGNDIGSQYRSGVYTHSQEQLQCAMESKKRESARIAQTIVTEIKPATAFCRAEEQHQQFLEKGGQCAQAGSLEPIRCYG
jgi:methionine-S-sulfoxide reductase